MTVLGHIVVYVALVTAGLAAVQYYRTTRNMKALGSAQMMVRLSLGSVVVASLILLWLLLAHDFSNGYVVSYSDRSLPLHFLISSFYAGQEGSFLFWALCGSIIAPFLAHFARPRKNEAHVMTVFMAVQAFMLLLVAAKSPFHSVWDMFPQLPTGQLPMDGQGLNPLLQNFWMVIHPPVLFLGFALMAVPFSLALGGLWKGDASILTRQSFSWVLAATGVLGLGIMLGAYWAYGVLGWGGYWGWDPVENSSLIPWLTGVALLHTMLAQIRTGRYVRTTFLLAIVSFLLVIFSTFLTRSGILGDASVHAFSDPGATVYWLLLVLQAAILVIGVSFVVRRWKQFSPPASGAELLTRETSLGAGAIVLLLSAAVILFGTSLPIFSTVRVEPSFYDTTNLPVAIAIVILIGISLYAQWEMQDGRAMLKRSSVALGLSAVAAAVLWVLGVQHILMLLLAVSSVFAFIVNVDIGIKVARGNPRFLGGKLAHMGVALFFLGVISTGKYATTEHAVLPLGESRQVLGRSLTYTGSERTPDNKYRFNVVMEEGGQKHKLGPVMFDGGRQGVMRNPDILSHFSSDFYISPVSVEQLDGNGAQGASYTIEKGKTIALEGVKATFVRFAMDAHATNAMTDGNGAMRIGSVLQLSDGKTQETVTPTAVYQQDGAPVYEAVNSQLLHANVKLTAMNVGMGDKPSTVTVAVEKPGVQAAPVEALVVDVSEKPWINFLWGGTIVMMVGFALSVYKRSKES